MNRSEFYAKATSRNIGLVTEGEQEILKRSRVAIAGMGAVGGHYLLALARMGVGKFTTAGGRFSPEVLHSRTPLAAGAALADEVLLPEVLSRR